MNDLVNSSGHTAKRPEDTNAAFDHFRHHQRQLADVTLVEGEDALVFHGNLDGNDIFEAYLAAFATEELRQEHNCRCCRQFFRHYANVMVSRPADTTSWKAVPLFFHEVPEYDTVAEIYRGPMRAVRELLLHHNTRAERPVMAVGEELSIGESIKGGYSHYNFRLKGLPRVRNRSRSIGQNQAEILQTRNLFQESVGRWNQELLDQSNTLFQNDGTLGRTKFRDILARFIELRSQMRANKDHNVRSVLSLKVAMREQTGVSRIGQTVLGEFLDSRARGDSVEKAKSDLLTRINPTDYMRPKAAPTRQAIHQAEATVAALGLKESLRRRSLRRDEIPEDVKLWSPPAPTTPEADTSVFGHLKAKNPEPSFHNGAVISGGTISLAALAQKILDGEYKKIEIAFGSYEPTTELGSWTTEAVAGAKPILLWDREDRRNPVSSYRYSNPVHPTAQWGVAGRVEVVAITRRPDQWYSTNPVAYDELDYVLAGGYDRNPHVHIPLFPETLIGELHGVRSVIEAFCKEGRLEDVDKGLVFWGYTGQQRMFYLTLPDNSVVTYNVVTR